MCLVIYLPKGSDKTDKFLAEAIKKASEFNGDGMGYAIKKQDNSLYLDKGYFDVEHFINVINNHNLTENDELLIHLRIGNKGAVDSAMCHPFVVSNDEEEITMLDGITDKPIVVHNGTMSRHAVHNSDKSDTFFFIKNVLSKQSVLNFVREDGDTFVNVMQPHLLGSRLAIMYPDDHNTTLLGTWHELNGYYFSKDYNNEYFPKKYKFSTNLPWEYDDDVTDDWYRKYYRNKADLDKEYANYNTSKKTRPKNKVVDIPELAYDRPYFKDNYGFKHVLYMGLYLPDAEGLKNYTIEVNNNNCKDVIIDLINSDYILSLYKGKNYSVVKVDGFNITVNNDTDNHEVEVPIADFYETFRVNLIGQDLIYYNDYYELVRDLPVSKNLSKKLNESLNKAIEKGQDYFNFKHDNVTHKNINIMIAAEFLKSVDDELEIRKNPELLLF